MQNDVTDDHVIQKPGNACSWFLVPGSWHNIATSSIVVLPLINIPQYTPTPREFGYTPSLLLNYSFISSNPITSVKFHPPQTNLSRTDKLPLLEYRDRP